MGNKNEVFPCKLALALNNCNQSINWFTIKQTTTKNKLTPLIKKQAGLTNACVSLKLPSTFASANLFLNPLPKPVSIKKVTNQ